MENIKNEINNFDLESMEFFKDIPMDDLMGKRVHIFGSISCPYCKNDLKIVKSFYPWERLEYQCEKCHNIINISDLGMTLKQQYEIDEKKLKYLII